jgi:hypothetical protein
VPSNPSVNEIFHSEEKMIEKYGHDNKHYANYCTVRNPPEDPHMNNGNEEIHPQEPTLINFRYFIKIKEFFD